MRAIIFAMAVAAAGPALADNVYQFAEHSPQHRLFATTMQATGIDRALANPGPYTIFAPTDQAFSSVEVGALMRPENREELVQLLTCHMVPSAVITSALVGGKAQVVRTVGGCTLTIQRDASGLLVTDANGQRHRVLASDLRQANGVVHVLDSLITPSKPSRDPA